MYFHFAQYDNKREMLTGTEKYIRETKICSGCYTDKSFATPK